MTPFLRLEDLKKVWKSPRGETVAVQGVNLNVKMGEFVSFIGHSGCGKSTVLNMVAGLMEPTEGAVWIEGRRVKGPGSDRAMVFQNYSLLPWLTVRENVWQAVDAVYEKHLAGADKNDLVDRFLKTVNLWDHRDKRPGQLSGGMKQRVAIARAFAIKPDVLIMDEPFGALDALTKGSLHDELLRAWGEVAEKSGGRRQTILMVTHDIDEAIYLSDRIVVMTDGPGATIGEVIEVPIERPRDKRAMIHLAQYADIKDHLLELLEDSHALKMAA